MQGQPNSTNVLPECTLIARFDIWKCDILERKYIVYRGTGNSVVCFKSYCGSDIYFVIEYNE